jgi:hypothetical protein
MKEVVGGWRRLRNEELHNLYASSHVINVIKPERMRWVGHIVCMGEMRNTCKIFIGIPEGTRTLERPRHRWDDNMNAFYGNKVGGCGLNASCSG